MKMDSIDDLLWPNQYIGKIEGSMEWNFSAIADSSKDIWQLPVGDLSGYGYTIFWLLTCMSELLTWETATLKVINMIDFILGIDQY